MFLTHFEGSLNADAAVSVSKVSLTAGYVGYCRNDQANPFVCVWCISCAPEHRWEQERPLVNTRRQTDHDHFKIGLASGREGLPTYLAGDWGCQVTRLILGPIPPSLWKWTEQVKTLPSFVIHMSPVTMQGITLKHPITAIHSWCQSLPQEVALTSSYTNVMHFKTNPFNYDFRISLNLRPRWMVSSPNPHASQGKITVLILKQKEH